MFWKYISNLPCSIPGGTLLRLQRPPSCTPLRGNFMTRRASKGPRKPPTRRDHGTAQDMCCAGRSVISKLPKQARSADSVTRTLNAVAKLLKEKNGRVPTITEVGHCARVSMSSIYARFDSMDSLLFAALSKAVADIETKHAEMLAQAQRGTPPLHLFISRLIDDIGRFTQENAPLLRALMQRSIVDRKVRELAMLSYQNSMSQVQQAVLRYRDDIDADDPELAAQSIFRVAYAAMAGFFALGQELNRNGRHTWIRLKQDLALMCMRTLKATWPANDS